MTSYLQGTVDAHGMLRIPEVFCARMGVKPGNYLNVRFDDEAQRIWLGWTMEGGGLPLDDLCCTVLPKELREKMGWLCKNDQFQDLVRVDLLVYGGELAVQSASDDLSIPVRHCLLCLNPAAIPLEKEGHGICRDCLRHFSQMSQASLYFFTSAQVVQAGDSYEAILEAYRCVHAVPDGMKEGGSA